ncbi:hypothetical protein D3I60_14875 [Brevibacterium permense]|uniref:Ltp family lipoprotein n=1 Tax=Brevibacterium permense TaxID=234834 RepID=UPI0034E2D40E|nr:hypothetical protein [Brevibacterium permense]
MSRCSRGSCWVMRGAFTSMTENRASSTPVNLILSSEPHSSVCTSGRHPLQKRRAPTSEYDEQFTQSEADYAIENLNN